MAKDFSKEGLLKLREEQKISKQDFVLLEYYLDEMNRLKETHKDLTEQEITLAILSNETLKMIGSLEKTYEHNLSVILKRDT